MQVCTSASQFFVDATACISLSAIISKHGVAIERQRRRRLASTCVGFHLVSDLTWAICPAASRSVESGPTKAETPTSPEPQGLQRAPLAPRLSCGWLLFSAQATMSVARERFLPSLHCIPQSFQSQANCCSTSGERWRAPKVAACQGPALRT